MRYYVYLYRIDGEVAYVGKGQGKRAFAHLKKAKNPILRQRIFNAKSVRVKIIKQDMSEADAFRLEKRCINKWSATVSNRTQGTRTSTEAAYAECLMNLKHNIVDYGTSIFFTNGAAYDLVSKKPAKDCWQLRVRNNACLRRELRSIMRALEKADPNLKRIKYSEVSHA